MKLKLGHGRSNRGDSPGPVMFEYIFGINNVIPIDLRLDFGVIMIDILQGWAYFWKPCRSLLLSTTPYLMMTGTTKLAQ